MNKEFLGDSLNDIFNEILRDVVDNETNPIIEELLKDKRLSTDVIRDVKYNINEYVRNILQGFSKSIYSITQEIVLNEQDFITTIKKVNLVCDKTDGKLLSGNMTRIYNLSPTNEVSQKKTEGAGQITNTYEELITDYTRFNKYLNDFDKLLNDNGIITTTYEPIGNFKPKNSKFVNTEPNKRFFILMSRILTDKNKKNDFIKGVIKGGLLDYKKPKYQFNLNDIFTDIVDKLSKQYKEELDDEEKIIKDFKKKNEYKKFVNGVEESLYPKGKIRKFTYTTVPNESKQEQQKINLLDIYATTNSNTDKKTFDGKVKLES